MTKSKLDPNLRPFYISAVHTAVKKETLIIRQLKGKKWRSVSDGGGQHMARIFSFVVLKPH